MKIKNKILAFFLMLCLSVTMYGTQSFAASGRVSFSDPSGKVGSTVTVSATVKSSSGPIGSATVTLSYNPSALQYVGGSGGTNGGSGSVRYAGFGDGSRNSLSFTMKFKILKEGSHKISGSADGYTFDEEQMSMSVGSSTVKGTVPAPKPDTKPDTKPDDKKEPNKKPNKDDNKDKKDDKDDKDKEKPDNSKLSSLKVYPGTMSPKFSVNTRSYTVKVSEDTKEVAITAKAQDSKAKVSVSGGKDLKPGENKAKVIVIAQDGSASSYSLTIICGEEKEEPKEFVTIGDKNYTIDETFEDDSIPVGFKRDKAAYNGKDYEAVSHEKGSMTLLHLMDENEEKEFFIYDTVKNEFYPFLQIQISEIRYIIPIPMAEEMPEQMTSVILTLQEKDFGVWQECGNSDMYILNAMSSEGMNGFYSYDAVDSTYQRYTISASKNEPEVSVKDETSSNTIRNYMEKYAYILIPALGGAVVLLLILCIVFGVKGRKKENSEEKPEEILENTQEIVSETGVNTKNSVEDVDNQEENVYDDIEEIYDREDLEVFVSYELEEPDEPEVEIFDREESEDYFLD